ncbi:MAG: acyltransferase family protein [Pseudomonadota bacterium]
MTYRPELDGLRAIAVLAVVLYHAGFSALGQTLFQGGYLGVDIFFVISGYLITLILLKDLHREDFTFLGFYERRARRILPALVVVMAVSIPFAWAYMLPSAFKEYAGSLAAATLFGSNIYFWQQDEYAAEASELKPFLHTWSLSVEEQFYVLYPIALLLCWQFCRRYITLLFLGGLAVSLLLAEWASTRYDNANFFLAPSRAWELLAGALLAKLEVDRGFPTHRLANAALPTAGVLMILVPMLVLDDLARHPGLITLVPVAGTMLLIAFAGRGDPVSSLLASRAAVAVGLISYSLYLWHQPVFAFARIRATDAPTVADKTGWIVLAVLLATLSYWLVEKPFRNKRLVSRRLVWTMAAVGPAGVLAAGIYGFGTNGVPSRFDELPPFYFDVVEAAAEEQPSPAGAGSPCGDYGGDGDYCVFSNGLGEVTLATVGDSHMRVLSDVLRHRARDAAVIPLNRAACPLILGVDRISLAAGEAYRCDTEYNRQRMAVLRQNTPAVAIVGGRLPLILESSPFDNREGGVEVTDARWAFVEPDGDAQSPAPLATVRRQFRRTVEDLLRDGIRVVIVYPVPEVGWNVPQRLAQLMPKGAPKNMHGWVEDNMVSTSYEVFEERNASAYEVYDAVPDHPNLIRVYPERLFCNTRIPGRCITHDEERIYYRDDDHLSPAGAELLVDAMFERMRERWGGIAAADAGATLSEADAGAGAGGHE